MANGGSLSAPSPNWGKVRTIRRGADWILKMVTLFAGQSMPLIDEPTRWVHLTILEGELSLSVDGSTIRTAERQSRQTIPPGHQIMVHNRHAQDCLFTLLVHEPPKQDQS